MLGYVAVAISLIATAAEISGCGYDQLHLRAANELDCAPGKLDVTQVDDDRYRYSGCDKTAMYFCTVDSHGYQRCSLERPNPRAMVQEAAGRDFVCPPAQIVVDDVKAGFQAKGCDRTDVYACTPVLSSFRCERLGVPAAGSASSSPPAPVPPILPKSSPAAEPATGQ